MKAIQLASFGIIPAALFITACGDDVTKVTNVTNETSGMEIVASADSLEKCTPENAGKTAFVSGENTAYVCADSAWKKLLPEESSETEKSCVLEELSNESGFKVVCGGDSVGILGKSSAGCKLVDGGNGTLTQICGNDSTTFSLEFCDGVPYAVDSSFCFEKKVYAKCGGKAYSVDKDLCVDGRVFFNKALIWDKMNPEIEYGMFTDVRDSQVYRSVKIGEQTWMAENLNFEYKEGKGSFCYGNYAENCAQYGRMYPWSSAVDSAAVFGEAGKGCGDGVDSVGCGISDSVTVRGVCPEGWHLPDTTEWMKLTDFVRNNLKDTNDVDKQISANLLSQKDEGEDLYGFGALLGGVGYDGYMYMGMLTYFHSTFGSEKFSMVWNVYLNRHIKPDYLEKGKARVYVRCVKD